MGLNLPLNSIFAHRGGRKYAPENTLAAFQCGLESGCEGLELDVRLTADSQVVVCHDATVNRTTNGRGRINGLTLEQVQALDAGSWFHAQYREERIPTLEQVLAQFGGKTILNIELKANRRSAPELAALVAGQIKAHGLAESTIISSFSVSALDEIRKHLPHGNFSLLAAVGMFGWWARRVVYNPQHYFALHPDYRDVIPAGIKLHPRQIAYTVNQSEDMQRLFSLDILGIITDDPQLAVKIRAEVLL